MVTFEKKFLLLKKKWPDRFVWFLVSQNFNMYKKWYNQKKKFPSCRFFFFCLFFCTLFWTARNIQMNISDIKNLQINISEPQKCLNQKNNDWCRFSEFFKKISNQHAKLKFKSLKKFFIHMVLFVFRKFFWKIAQKYSNEHFW